MQAGDSCCKRAVGEDSSVATKRLLCSVSASSCFVSVVWVLCCVTCMLVCHVSVQPVFRIGRVILLWQIRMRAILHHHRTVNSNSTWQGNLRTTIIAAPPAAALVIAPRQLQQRQPCRISFSYIPLTASHKQSDSSERCHERDTNQRRHDHYYQTPTRLQFQVLFLR